MKELNLERAHANQKVTQFFNWAFSVIIPWVNEFKPYGTGRIPIPDTLADIVKIKDLKMAVRDNYFAFTMDPEFIMKATEAERRRHMYVMASHAKGLDLWKVAEVLYNAFFVR